MKKTSQLFTFAELVKNNKTIFAKKYPRGWNENDSHYICKVFLGQQILRRYNKKMDLTYEYDGLPPMGTVDNPRHYKPDIFCIMLNDVDKKINISDIEINGKIHTASKHQYYKTKWRRENITDYFSNYTDERYKDYPIVFSYIVFEPEEFLYNKLDYFINIFDEKFFNGGHFPEQDCYEMNFL